MIASTNSHNNECHDSNIQHTHLQEKPNTNKFGSIFKLNMLSTILDGSQITKMVAMTATQQGDLQQKLSTTIF